MCRGLYAFLDTVESRIHNHLPIIGSVDGHPFREGETISPELWKKWVNDHDMRRQLVDMLLPRFAVQDDDWVNMLMVRPPLLIQEDFDWLLAKLEEQQDSGVATVTAKLVHRLLRRDRPDQSRGGVRDVSEDAHLATELMPLFEPVFLETDVAANAKAQYERLRKLEEQRPNQIVDPPLGEQIRRLLDQIESGDLNAWWRMTHLMLFEPDRTTATHQVEADLRKLPGWHQADSRTQARIIEAAYRYASDGRDELALWLGKDVWYYPAISAYKALLLLLNEAPDKLNDLPNPVWRRWAPIVVAYPSSYEPESEWQHQRLAKRTYDFAAQEILDTISIEVGRASSKGMPFSYVWKYELCWDGPFGSAILALAADPNITLDCFESLLDAALQHKTAGAQAFAQGYPRNRFAQMEKRIRSR